MSSHMKCDTGVTAQGRHMQSKFDRRAQSSERRRSSVAGRARCPFGIVDIVHTIKSADLAEQVHACLNACVSMLVMLPK